MELSKENYNELLSRYNKLRDCNKEKKQLGIHDYSLMNALLKKTDEVNLHSNFIYSMINPNGNHYCGNIFLELFLKSIGEANFINLDNARVHKEKGKVDLLIEDGEKVIIIENKLRAVDQKYQISRYIQYVIDEYLHGNKETLSQKSHIVYLSEYKAIPSKKSESIIGFILEGNKLKWNNEPVYKEIVRKDKVKEKLNLNLDENTQLKFNRVQHSKHLLNWIVSSKDWLSLYKPNNVSRSLEYAFDEYALILKRLNTKKRWRNLMSLDDYTLKIVNELEQEKMYAFMCEANKKLNNFIAEKLDDTVNELFPIEERIELKIREKKFENFTKENFINWLNKTANKDKYRDVGFKIKIEDDTYIFALGVNNIAYGKLHGDIDDWWDIKTTREKLQSNRDKNLFDIINDLKKFKDK